MGSHVDDLSLPSSCWALPGDWKVGKSGQTHSELRVLAKPLEVAKQTPLYFYVGITFFRDTYLMFPLLKTNSCFFFFQAGGDLLANSLLPIPIVGTLHEGAVLVRWAFQTWI